MENLNWFTDGKVLTVSSPRNPQNDRLYAAVGTKKNIVAAARLRLVLPLANRLWYLSACLPWIEHTSVHFVEPGDKVNEEYYRDFLLEQVLLPEIREFSEYDVFQQDGPPAHLARDTVRLFERLAPDCISPTLWPPHSLDLQKRIYKTKVRDVEYLIERILEAWDEFEQSIIDTSVNQ